MKKFFAFGFFVLASVFSLSAQSSQVSAANRKTAERCLQLAENSILADEWQNACNQAMLGISYDASISDLYYVAAAAMSNLGFTRREVLETVQKAFDKGNWINHNENHSRILYADLLCDTGSYIESLEALDHAPFVYSADAEFIRIKNYYRLGSEASIMQARTRLNSARKIYPSDSRFPYIFFMFESLFLMYSERSGISYEIPELVRTVAESYILKFPDYDNPSVDMEVLALLFSDGELQKRVLRAVGEKNQNSPLFAYVGLRSGILTEEKAYNLFFQNMGEEYPLYTLECFVPLIRDPGLKKNLKERLNSFSDTLLVDLDFDLQHELVVRYDRGRAMQVLYDRDCDGIPELSSQLDFGTPEGLVIDGGSFLLDYDIYPAVKKFSFTQSGKTFYFLNDDFEYTPFDMTLDPVFLNYGVDFYIPCIAPGLSVPDEHSLASVCSSLELPTSERPGSRVVYTVFGGLPVFASFTDSSSRYAYCTIDGYPFVRYVDYDGDGYCETAETYDFDRDSDFLGTDNARLVQNAFGENVFAQQICLKKVEIDRDADTVVEFREEYLKDGGKISAWDDDGDGIIDYETIRYPALKEGGLYEENIFYDSDGAERISVGLFNREPVRLRYRGQELDVLPGRNEGVYWLGNAGTAQEERLALASSAVDGRVFLLSQSDLEDGAQRVSVIRVDGLYFCRLVPASEVPEE